MMGITKSALSLALFAGSAKAQTTFFDAPEPLWVQTFLPMGDNNGLVWAPDDSLLYATSQDGTIATMNPDSGEVFWQFQPEGDGTVPFSMNGEVSFSSDGSTVIAAITAGDTCNVYALNPFGELIWTSPDLEGSCEGTPRFADDDAYVFVTHNSAGMTIGHFSVLDTAAGAASIYKFDEPEGPFAPFGFFADPFPGGNYPAGTGNSNDLAIWGLKPSPTATTGETGGVWVFQMPPATAIGGPAAVKVIEMTGWRYTAAPLLANGGQYLYWLISRSSVRAWYASPFTVGADGEYSFPRGTPTFKAAPYTPAVDDVASPTVMCGGPANPQFACFSATNIAEGTGEPLWTVETGGFGVFANPLMSTGGDRVYFIDNAGLVTAASSADGTGGWSAPTSVNIEANAALSSDGARLFFADVSGNVVAWQVAESTLPPVGIPEMGPTAAPVPTAEALLPPTAEPSMAPSGVNDTFAPSMTPMPTEEPTITPMPVTTAPVEEPTVPVVPTAPTPAGETTSGSSGMAMAVFSVLAASIVAVVVF